MDSRAAGQKNAAGEIVMPGGHMTLEQLTALLNTVPLEISFIDTENINRFFNEGPKVFKRPAMAIDREVFSCHPPKIEPMVRAIIEDFRNNKRNRVPVWMEKGGRTMLVTYMAVRDKNGEYLGTAEFVQDMEFAKEHFGKENGPVFLKLLAANNRMHALRAFYCHELKKVMQNLENRGFCITFFAEFIVQ